MNGYQRFFIVMVLAFILLILGVYFKVIDPRIKQAEQAKADVKILRQQFEDYLEAKYDEEFIVNPPHFASSWSTGGMFEFFAPVAYSYEAEAYLKSNSEVKFIIEWPGSTGGLDEEFVNNGFRDEYISEILRYRAIQVLDPYIKDVFGYESYIRYININLDVSYFDYEDPEVFKKISWLGYPEMFNLGTKNGINIGIVNFRYKDDFNKDAEVENINRVLEDIIYKYCMGIEHKGSVLRIYYVDIQKKKEFEEILKNEKIDLEYVCNKNNIFISTFFINSYEINDKFSQEEINNSFK